MNIETMLGIMHDSAKQHLDECFKKFETNPGDTNWSDLIDAMWIWQGVRMGGLNREVLIDIINTKPMPSWLNEIYKAHYDKDVQ